MKLKTAITYRLQYQFRSFLIYLGFFFLFAFLFPLIGMVVSNTKITVESDLIFPAMIFMIILAIIGIQSDFKLFIQNSMSRKNIFLANLVTNAFLSILGASLLLLIQKIFAHLISNFSFSMSLVDTYTKGYLLKSWLFASILLFFASTLGLVFGIFNDRITGLKKLLVILTLIMIPSLLAVLAQIAGTEFKLHLFDFIKKIVGITDTGLNLAPLLITLFVFAGVNLVLTYLLNRKREIKRINA